MTTAAQRARRETAPARAINAYNDGVKLMLDKRYAEAQARFEAALDGDENLAARLDAVLKGAMRDEYYGLARQRD